MKLPQNMRIRYCLSSEINGLIYSQIYSKLQLENILKVSSLKFLNLYKILTNSKGNISFYHPEIDSKIWVQKKSNVPKKLASFPAFFWVSYEYKGKIGASKNTHRELIDKLDCNLIKPVNFIKINTNEMGEIQIQNQSLDEVLDDLIYYSQKHR